MEKTTYTFEIHLYLPPHPLNSTHSKRPHIRDPGIINQDAMTQSTQQSSLPPFSISVSLSENRFRGFGERNSLNTPHLPLNLPKHPPRTLHIRNITAVCPNLHTLPLARRARRVLFRGAEVQEREVGAGFREREGDRGADA
jgi:hypothetical protein